MAVARSGADLDPTDIFDHYERAVVFRSHAEIGRRVRTGDRGNVGIIDALDDDNGAAAIVITSPNGRSVTRRSSWSTSRRLRSSRQRPLGGWMLSPVRPLEQR